jgi:hypothetical protein
MSGNDGSAEYDRELARMTTIVLAEFAALRSEMVTRITQLMTLILGNLTVLGILFGMALSHPGNANVLLLLPIVTPCIGMLVIDSFRNCDILSRYIYKILRPQLHIRSRLKIDGVEMFEWERWVSKRQLTPWFAGPFQFVLLLEFAGPPIAVLSYTIQYHFRHPHMQVSTLQSSLWLAGAVLTGALIPYAIGYLTYSIWHPRGSKKLRESGNANDIAVGPAPL